MLSVGDHGTNHGTHAFTFVLKILKGCCYLSVPSVGTREVTKSDCPHGVFQYMKKYSKQMKKKYIICLMFMSAMKKVIKEIWI